jgi:hypothetical protein
MTVQPFSVPELVKILLPSCVAGAIGWLLLRRLEEIKSEVVRYSDFSRKWAELFFDASNAFMITVERYMTIFHFLAHAADPNDQAGMAWQQQANALLPALVENHYRIQRLAALAPSKGSAGGKAAVQIVESVGRLTKTKMGNLDDIRREIDIFNNAVREAHSEMLASRRVRTRR